MSTNENGNLASENDNSQNEEVELMEGDEDAKAQEVSSSEDEDDNQAEDIVSSSEDENELDEEAELDLEGFTGNGVDVGSPGNPASARVQQARQPAIPLPPPPMPILKLKAVKMSSFVTNHTSSTQTIQFHVASLILPPECLVTIANHQVEFPLYFQLTNPQNEKSTCCGVVEFTAERGTCSIPDWVMDNLNIKEGSLVSLELKVLELGTFVKLEPQSMDFLKIKDPKAVLEETLRKYPCISTGDIIQIPHKGDVYMVKVLETKPTPSVKITDSDLTVDFAPPAVNVDPNNKSVPFSGTGHKLGVSSEMSAAVSAAETKLSAGNASRAIPDWTFQLGEIGLNRRSKPQDVSISTSSNKHFEAFSGTGISTHPPTSPVKKQAENGRRTEISQEKSEDNESDAPSSKIRKTEDALDVSEATIPPNSDTFSALPDHDDDAFELSSDDEVDSEEEDSAPEPDDPNDPDYTENMEID